MKVTWQSPSNIALIKYWGKHGNQLPNNASLSLTLSEAFTKTTVELKKKRSKKNIELDFLFEGTKNSLFEEKITAYLLNIKTHFPFLETHRITISTGNSFPHSAGIASSASSMSALALCLVSLRTYLSEKAEGDFFQTASHFARLGSGSAARSVYANFALWGKTTSVKNSSDSYAIEHPKTFHPDFSFLQDTILLVNKEEKKVSSRAGHTLMQQHPMEKQRYANAQKRLAAILPAIQKGDWETFCEATEAEALELHALMMTSTPPFLLMQPGTLAIIEKIQRFRKETKIPVCFTLDAGPNIHTLYPYSEKKSVRNFIQSELLQHCVQRKAIYDEMGKGPKQIVEE